MPGFEAKFVHPLLKRHECPICLFAMRMPVQTECGHLFCRDCLKPVLNKMNPVCPVDKVDISSDGVFPDNACRREILCLEVYCCFVVNNCKWTGPLKELESHLEVCEYRNTTCTLCGESVMVIRLAEHQETDCPMRTEVCEFCQSAVPYKLMEKHLKETCEEVKLTCPHNCSHKQEMKRIELDEHLNPKTGDCPLMEVNCPFKPYGCIFVSQRQNIPAHLQKYNVYHVTIQVEADIEMREKVEKTLSDVQHATERLSMVESRVGAVEKLQDAFEQRMEVFDEMEPARGATAGGHESLLAQKVKALEQKVANLMREPGRLSPPSLATSGYVTGSSVSSVSADPLTGSELIPKRMETIHSKVVELDQTLDRCVKNCINQELRLQLLERATYNGVLLWKIDEFERRYKEATSGVTLSLFSTPFYTSRNGYKMCGRVYLNGDGMGKDTHLSLFFVVMKGPFDALLPWPFRQKVVFTLINQNGKKNVVDSFHPDPLSNSFQRPIQKEINVASGCPMFVRLEQLFKGGFIKEDCIFLRITIETSNLPEKPI